MLYRFSQWPFSHILIPASLPAPRKVGRESIISEPILQMMAEAMSEMPRILWLRRS